MTGPHDYAVVVPSIGRPSLYRLLETLAGQAGPRPAELVVVDDRPAPPGASAAASPIVLAALPFPTRVVRTQGRGPAAARNAGWRCTSAPWVVFLDDDVELLPHWAQALAEDLRAVPADGAGSQAQLHVPLPGHRRPTDWERGTAGLQDAAWATADMAYRRSALEQVHGFDERFPRAYREDADLALRVLRAGWRLTRGERVTLHPVRPADDLVSLRAQRGNADDVLMRVLHGPGWREDGDVPTGAFPRHVATTLALVGAGAAVAVGRPREAALAGAAWAFLSTDFLRRRLLPGPRPGDPEFGAEARRMLVTSLAIPPAAVAHRLRGAWRVRRGAPAWPPPVRAVLFDRDGTLVRDVPYNGDPDRVKLMPFAREALDAVRAAGLRTGVVSNQSGVARGLLTIRQVEDVNAEIDRRLGGLGVWRYCPHGPESSGADCACRKPGPGLVLAAARELGVEPYECLVVGDIGADLGAAVSAGARAVLVPTAQTRPEEVAAAPVVAADLLEAVGLAVRLAGGTGEPAHPAPGPALDPASGTGRSPAAGGTRR
ncbi:HAD-IIIA family hydrolase [Kineosporia sp. J2-2]|uniref:D,D-heptose 1,7-bisphosphate phosphatase n=1 Tax=Kineosporia corallincola TaxID=2835133 RepID=A0ABS5TJ72_9ACTN|nr:HAD-IIIA family hydrolase [Kineosporia corallincola]MBT0769629.1 HAD-IIIA family hydrolase [Kineosporia corallincola]